MDNPPEQNFRYVFEWDPDKARSNIVKHKVSFELATTVFQDQLAVTIFDPDHSENEERWITLGRAMNNAYLVVVHTWEDLDPYSAKLRIISVRDATRLEIREYQENAK